MSRWLSLVPVLFFACRPQAAPPAVVAAPPAPPVAAQVSEHLVADATYADLVSAASALLDKEERAPSCLLAREPSGFHLRAEVAASVRPLPSPADELGVLLKGAEHVELLSAWGRHGDGTSSLALVSFTLAAPAREAVALFATARGFSVRGASGTALTPRDELTLDRVAGVLAEVPTALVFVAAGARYPVSALHTLLATLAQREVTLAVNLAANTKLKPPAQARVLRCPDGLPATTEAEGALPTDQLLASVAPLKDAGSDCLLRGDARGAAGGRLTLGLRIDPRGKVSQACIVRDELGDDAVASCVTELAHRLSFPPPAPAGVVDVELPVALRPGPRVVQPALCAP